MFKNLTIFIKTNMLNYAGAYGFYKFFENIKSNFK